MKVSSAESGVYYSERDGWRVRVMHRGKQIQSTNLGSEKEALRRKWLILKNAEIAEQKGLQTLRERIENCERLLKVLDE